MTRYRGVGAVPRMVGGSHTSVWIPWWSAAITTGVPRRAARVALAEHGLSTLVPTTRGARGSPRRDCRVHTANCSCLGRRVMRSGNRAPSSHSPHRRNDPARYANCSHRTKAAVRLLRNSPPVRRTGVWRALPGTSPLVRAGGRRRFRDGQWEFPERSAEVATGVPRRAVRGALEEQRPSTLVPATRGARGSPRRDARHRGFPRRGTPLRRPRPGAALSLQRRLPLRVCFGDQSQHDRLRARALRPLPVRLRAAAR